MAALEQNFEVWSGNDVTLNISVFQDEELSTPYNLSSVTALIWAIGKSAKAAVTLQKTLGAGIQILDALTGKISVTLTAADLEPLKGEYYHEMRSTSSAGKATIMFGSVNIIENLIRS